MATSATWIVTNPSAGTEYIAPQAYWVVPAAGSSVTVTTQTFDGSGNLITVSSMTAICRNISSGSDAGSFTYNGGNTVNATTSNGTNGGNVFAPAGKINSGSPAQLRMYITYTGSAYDQPPNAPANLSPSGLITTLTPTMYATFSDPTSGDTLAQHRVQVTNAANGGGAYIWDSGNVGASSSETSAAAMSTAYGGSALAFGSQYSWRCQFANQNGNWGPWSGWTNFNTVSGPNTPTITAPTGAQTTLTPAWSFGYSSPTAVAMASYRLVVQAVPAYNWIYDSGWVTDSAASGATITGSVPSAAGLQYGGSYAINFMVKDTNGATSSWSQLAFSVAALPQVAPSSPVGGATVTTQTPLFTWTYTDQNYPQGQAQVEIQNATTGVDILLTGWMSQSAAAYTSTTSIAYGTQIRWRVQVQDTAGLGSGWSAWASAYVNNAPSATITSPAAGGTVATVTPTITWTYTVSSGGQAEASATVVLADAFGNQIASYPQSGAVLSYTLPSGVLINGVTYRVTVQVTDTNSVTGQSAAVTFTVSLTPPADMMGQPLASSENWVTNALLNTDSNNDGVADTWASVATAGVTTAYAVDLSVTTGLALASGDGAIMGAQRVALSGVTAAGQYARVTQGIALTTPSWTAGTTKLSAFAFALVSVVAGAPTADVMLEFWNGTTFLSSVKSATPLGDTAGTLTRLLGPQGVTIPASTTLVKITLELVSAASGDSATVWWADAQLEAALTSDAHSIEGSLGTGYSYDATGFSLRTQLAGGIPTALAVPGADTDPVNAYGGSIVFSWDTTLADTRFTGYLIERRRQDESNDDTDWVTLATLTNASQRSYTDYSAASQTTYQYAVRQQIVYASGGVGVSQRRAIATGSVNFSPAWYLTNAGQSGAPIYNMRLRYVQSKRQFAWKERANYSAFLGRIGAARDAGQPAGYTHTLVCHFTELRGDSRQAIRRQLVTMQQLGGVWYLKDPSGLAVPVFIQDITFADDASYSETILTATLSLLQAQDTTDY